MLRRLESTGEINWQQVLQRAEQAFRALTGFLESSTFFFGEHTTAIDAKVFGHLLPLTQAPPVCTTSPPLTQDAWPRLFEYVESCCKLLVQIESVPLEGMHLQPVVERRREADMSTWVNKMAAAPEEADEKKSPMVGHSWADASRLLAPFVMAGDCDCEGGVMCVVLGAALLGFMLLRKVRGKLGHY